VFAVDGSTGNVLWKYEHKLPDDWGGYNVPFFTGKHRGLALAGNNVYFLSNDAKLHSIDMKTGKGNWVKSYEGFPYPKDFAKSQDANGFITTVGPMAIPGGTIIVPMNATDTGGMQGYVLGVDAATGEQKWKAAMIPTQGEPGYDSWPPGSQEFGGAGPWIVGSWDAGTKMYYTGTANAYEWNPKNRGGGKLDNVGAASIVAVNTDNGKVAWRYVGVPGDPWDFDIPQTPMVINMDGKKTIVQPNKTGYVHYLDAMTGKFIKADKFIDKVTWIKGYDKNGRPIDAIPLPSEGGDPVEIYPSLLGGVNMYPNAYNPKTGNLYLAASESGMKYGFEEIKVISNVRHFGAYQEFLWGNETDKAVNVKSRQGSLAQRAQRQARLRGWHADYGGEHHGVHHAGRRIHRCRRGQRQGAVLGEPRRGGQVRPDHLLEQRQAIHRAGSRRVAGFRPRRAMEIGVRQHGGRVYAGVKREVIVPCEHINGGALCGASIFVRIRFKREKNEIPENIWCCSRACHGIGRHGCGAGTGILLATNPLSGDEKAIKSGKGWFRQYLHALSWRPCRWHGRHGHRRRSAQAQDRLPRILCDGEKRPPGPGPGPVHAILFFPG